MFLIDKYSVNNESLIYADYISLSFASNWIMFMPSKWGLSYAKSAAFTARPIKIAFDWRISSKFDFSKRLFFRHSKDRRRSMFLCYVVSPARNHVVGPYGPYSVRSTQYQGEISKSEQN